MRVLLCFLLAMFVVSASYAKERNVIIVNPSSPKFKLQIDSNRTTGYGWYLKSYNSNIIKPVSHQYQPSKGNMPGAIGHESWTFEVKQPGFAVPQLTELKFVYVRPWVPQKAEKKMEFIIVIGGSSNIQASKHTS